LNPPCLYVSVVEPRAHAPEITKPLAIKGRGVLAVPPSFPSTSRRKDTFQPPRQAVRALAVITVPLRLGLLVLPRKYVGLRCSRVHSPVAQPPVHTKPGSLEARQTGYYSRSTQFSSVERPK